MTVRKPFGVRCRQRTPAARIPQFLRSSKTAEVGRSLLGRLKWAVQGRSGKRLNGCIFSLSSSPRRLLYQ